MPLVQRRFAKFLVAYYGMLQVLHILTLLRASVVWIQTGSLGFPAPPPTGGWTSQARHFLIATGMVDAMNVVLAFVFVYGVFRRKAWSVHLGLVTMTITVYSAVVFSYGTWMSHAWSAAPFEYALVSLLFLPPLVLAGLFYYAVFVKRER